jgi:hypothetical protein
LNREPEGPQEERATKPVQVLNGERQPFMVDVSLGLAPPTGYEESPLIAECDCLRAVFTRGIRSSKSQFVMASTSILT